MSVNQRVKELYIFLKIGEQEFCDSIGQKRTTINNIVKGTSKPSYKVTRAILEQYPSLNANWLITGEGEMWKEESEEAILEEAKSKAEKYADKIEAIGGEKAVEMKVKMMEKLLKLMEREIRRHAPDLADELGLD